MVLGTSYLDLLLAGTEPRDGWYGFMNDQVMNQNISFTITMKEDHVAHAIVYIKRVNCYLISKLRIRTYPIYNRGNHFNFAFYKKKSTAITINNSKRDKLITCINQSTFSEIYCPEYHVKKFFRN